MSMTAIRTALIGALNAEFGPDPVTFLPAKLATAAGMDGQYGGVYPESQTERPGMVNEAEFRCCVQFFDQWGPVGVEPAYDGDLATLESYADRVINALKTQKLAVAWFVRVLSVTYEPDPTGRVSRFSAHVLVIADNPFYT